MITSNAAPAIIIGAAMAAAASSFSLGLWSFGAPGPGFFPFAASVVMALAVLVDIATRSAHEKQAASPDLPRFLAYCLAIVGFIVAVVVIGTGPAIFIFLALVLGHIERLGWKRSMAIGGISAAVSWGIFRDILGVPLPQGLWS